MSSWQWTNDGSLVVQNKTFKKKPKDPEKFGVFTARIFLAKEISSILASARNCFSRGHGDYTEGVLQIGSLVKTEQELDLEIRRLLPEINSFFEPHGILGLIPETKQEEFVLEALEKLAS